MTWRIALVLAAGLSSPAQAAGGWEDMPTPYFIGILAQMALLIAMPCIGLGFFLQAFIRLRTAVVLAVFGFLFLASCAIADRGIDRTVELAPLFAFASVLFALLFGTGWFAGMHFPFENIVSQVAGYREELAALGKDATSPTVAMNRLLVLAGDDAEARATGGPAVDPPNLNATVPTQLVGSPDEVAASIRTYAQAGVTHMQLRVFPAGVSFEHAVRTLNLFREAVLPQLD